MLSKVLNFVLVILVIGFIARYVYRMPKFNDGEKAPEIEANLMDGQPFKLSDLEGKYVLIDFWGSWCGPCRRENPFLVGLYDTFNDQKFSEATGFEIVSIGIEKNEARWKKAIAKDSLKWKYHIPQMDRFQSPIAQNYGIVEIPTKYFVGPKGEIILVNPVIADIEQYLSEHKI